MHTNSKKVVMLTIIGIIIIFIFATGILYFFTGKITIRSKNEDACNFEGFKGYSNLEIFPSNQLIKESVKEYSYFCMDSFMDPKCKIYMECEYSDKEFYTEKERLKNVIATLEGKTNSILYNKDYFEYPAYVSIYNWSSCYEYALIIENEKKIVYVFVQGDSQKAPKKYQPNKDQKEAESFSIYSFDGKFELKYDKVD